MFKGRWNTTSLSPADLVPLICDHCGSALEGGDEAALFVCPACGRAHEPREDGLSSFLPQIASVTTELAVAGPVQYLAIWRLAVSVSGAEVSAWERIRKVMSPGPAYLYVPAFSLARPVVQRLGVSLTEIQPSLELASGSDVGGSRRPTLVGVGMGQPKTGVTDQQREGELDAASVAGPGFDIYSPVLVGRQDARVLAHFVYLAVESHETRDLRSIDYELEATGEDLFMIPAVWDPRYIHESNWRLLLREFDGLVA